MSVSDHALATKVARAELMKRVLIVVTAVMVLVVLVMLVVLLGRVRNTQVDNTSKNDARDETLELIKDCTDPAGTCFKRAQARTAKAVGDINRVIILAAACASKPYEQTVEQVAECVTRRLDDPTLH